VSNESVRGQEGEEEREVEEEVCQAGVDAVGGKIGRGGVVS